MIYNNGLSQKLHHSPFNIAVIAAGLGFFIDAFDLFLFNVYRIPSLKELGYSGAELTHTGEMLLAMQMGGMMAGGIIAGMLGDRKGRVAALYASIIVYSLANIANSFVNDVNSYAIIRFIAGMGLAGELGSGITLVAESMSNERRGYGTILVATLGALGALSAGLAGDFLPWRQAFLFAGCAGFLLLFLRIKSMESHLFLQSKSTESKQGSFRLLFSDKKRVTRYFACILMGVPIWYSVGLLITLSPELAEQHHIEGLKLSTCFILFQAGIAAGDLSSGILSQLFHSRKKILICFMFIAITSTLLHFIRIINSDSLNLTSFLMGLGCGYLSVFVTSTAEHFGTNLRVTVTATVTNFMRGAVVLLIPFHQLIERGFDLSLFQGLLITGIIVWCFALISVFWLPETYGRNLEFAEK